jgi:hypothetical protein
VLEHYSLEYEAMLEIDASDSIVLGILSQKQRDDLWRLIAYFSKTINLAECNYLIYDKELLAIIRVFEEYRAELKGLANPIQVYSNHKALEYFMTIKNLSAKQAC